MSALRERLRSIARAVGETRQSVIETGAELSARVADLDERLGPLEAALSDQREESARAREILRSICDREPWQRERLRELRDSDNYLEPFSRSDPLISVVIPTFENHAMLRERAIPSILAQTYQHFEVVVVGDGAPDETRATVESFGDARIRYRNLAYRGPYPDDPRGRWLVAGVPPYNEAVRLARGSWIAPLDDDDEFRAEHLERALERARSDRLEFVYGKILQRLPDGSSTTLGRFPPVCAQFGLQSALYHAGLAKIFQLELTDYLFGLPYDWGLCQRMLRAGVQMGMIDEVSVDYYPSSSWRPSTDAGAEHAPEWEFVPEGWARAKRADDLTPRGWDVAEVAQAYAEHWPEFCAAIAGSRPLAVAHEVAQGTEMATTSLVAHNAALTLAYALARTARRSRAVSVLDWGGALGHQHAIARSALPETDFDWHVRELPAVCGEGRRASPSVTFHETDASCERSYDLVLASASFQYAEDWRALLHRLARATRDSLLITRLPLVKRHPSFVVLQRAQAYGYATEYLGWVFNAAELLESAATAGLELVREFLLQDPMDVAGAPEPPSHGAFLFRPKTL